MKSPKTGCFLKLAEWWILKMNALLVAQDPWRETKPRNSVKAKKAGSFIFQLQVLKSQQGVKPAVQAVRHGNLL